MLFSKLEINNTLFIFLHAEVVFRNFGDRSQNFGYFGRIFGDEHGCNTIDEPTICDIYNYLEKNETPDKIIIDCEKIDGAYNISTGIGKIIDICNNRGKDLAFCRMSEELYADSKIHQYRLSDSHNEDDTCNVYSTGCSKTIVTDDEIYELYKQRIVEKINSNYIIERKGEEAYSHSSNVLLPKYINIKTFIEQRDISFLGLYLLCKKAECLGLINDPKSGEKRPLLFFSSMAGSYLASVFSKLACVDMVFLNHLGPKKKLYRERHKDQLLSDRDYLIISDVVCLGSEIERAKTLIEHAGGKLKGILSIVLVEVVSERPSTENKIEKVALLTLSKGNNPINYQIKTDFQ